MPQSICQLCCDKINDFFEYREMCAATNVQTRQLLGLPETSAVKLPKATKGHKVEKCEIIDLDDCIFGVLGDEVKMELDDNRPNKSRKKGSKAGPASSKQRKSSIADATAPSLLTTKAPNKREIQREKSRKQTEK